MNPRAPETLESDFSPQEWRKDLREARKKSHGQFKQAFPEEQDVFVRNYEYLFQDEQVNLYSILRGLNECAIEFAEGSNTIAFQFDPEKLKEKFSQWAGEKAQEEEVKAQIEKFANYIANKFIMKEGRVKEFPVLLDEGSGEMNVFQRKDADRMFAASGYQFLPTPKKVRQDTEFSVGLIPFYGAPSGQLECNVPELIMRFLNNGFNCDELIDKKSDGKALISLAKGGGVNSVYDFFRNLAKETPERKGFDIYEGIETEEDLKARQTELREKIFSNKKTEEVVRKFFDSPVNPGIRSFFRRLNGEKHPEISFEQFCEVAQRIREKHKSKDYIAAEFTFEAPHVGTINEHGPKLIEHNRKVAALFAQELKTTLPREISEILGNEGLKFIALALLEYHHDFPDHEIDEHLGVISPSTIKFISRSVQNVVLHVLKDNSKKLSLDKVPLIKDVVDLADLPVERNVKFKSVLFNDPQVAEIVCRLSREQKSVLYGAVVEAVLKYDLIGGVKDEDGKAKEFYSIPTTYYVFQERVPAKDELETNEGDIVSMTLEKLFEPENKDILNEYPQVLEMVIETFLIYLNQFHETRTVLDRAGTKRGLSVFLEGQYGKTPNIIVVLNKSTGEVEMKQIDLRDPFVEYDEKVHKKSQGIVKHGFHVLIESILNDASLQIIGEAAETLLRQNGEEIKPKFDDEDEKYKRMGEDTVKRVYADWKETLTKMVGHTVHDAKVVIKDVRKAISFLIPR